MNQDVGPPKGWSVHGLATALVLSAAALSSFPAMGCGMLLGLEERTEEAALDGVEDKDSKIITTEQCVAYCDVVMSNCAEENAVYASRPSCINTCNALPPGDPTEPFDNTVECRILRANSASNAPEEFCAAAGPGGDGSCGSNCEAWCHLLENECPTDFASMSDCMGSCASITDDGGFNVNGSYERDDIQCRLIHMGAVAGDPVHCEHARYVPADKCSAPETGAPTCGKYCDTVMANCGGDDAVYDSASECMAACNALPLGDLSDRSENTVGCRLYHGTSAADDPATHCDHSAPTGDGHCGKAGDDTGNCHSYCLLLEGGCASEFAAEFSDTAECREACVEALADDGAEGDSFYTTATARDSDSLQCRVYYAVKALDGDADACAKAALGAACD